MDYTTLPMIDLAGVYMRRFKKCPITMSRHDMINQLIQLDRTTVFVTPEERQLAYAGWYLIQVSYYGKITGERLIRDYKVISDRQRGYAFCVVPMTPRCYERINGLCETAQRRFTTLELSE